MPTSWEPQIGTTSISLPRQGALWSPKMWTFSDYMPKVYPMRVATSNRTAWEMLRRLVLIHAVLSPEDMENRVEYL